MENKQEYSKRERSCKLPGTFRDVASIDLSSSHLAQAFSKNEMPVITAPHSAVFTTFEEYKTEKIIWENDAKGK